MAEEFFLNSLGQQLKVLNVLVEKAMNNGLKQLGLNLTGTQVGVLLMVQRRAPMTQKQIELALKLSHPTTRGIVKRLVTTGLVQTRPQVADQRQIVLTLTVTGQTLMANYAEQLQAQVARVEEQLLANLTAADRVSLQHLLTQMIQNMS
ncbi:MarR family transcriptional regulator [Lactiplantibacillus sp. WILCCON 0030]|uniref:MarR family transcriptional regulator n=1 Tax=Lactiplantibacillus brownii TaxID=3069269 RepID=A0ABU1ADG3_9LACO|nr:MarR family transcriptional regulator [Lactiplantibacillus brownii]MDQ7938467.1 MarR family transcriptional regulator [Lactiplantibacillus brownii]